jgi:hypothetical protein
MGLTRLRCSFRLRGEQAQARQAARSGAPQPVRRSKASQAYAAHSTDERSSAARDGEGSYHDDGRRRGFFKQCGRDLTPSCISIFIQPNVTGADFLFGPSGWLRRRLSLGVRQQSGPRRADARQHLRRWYLTAPVRPPRPRDASPTPPSSEGATSQTSAAGAICCSSAPSLVGGTFSGGRPRG